MNQTRQLWHLHNNIHGPFDFASVNGRRTETVLHRRIGSKYYKFQYLFSEYVPSLELPTRTSTLNIISVLSMYFDTAWTIGLQNITYHSCVACGGIMFCPGLSTPSLYRLSDIKHTPQNKAKIALSDYLANNNYPQFFLKRKKNFESITVTLGHFNWISSKSNPGVKYSFLWRDTCIKREELSLHDSIIATA